jgi:hypothetical protein
MVIRYFRERLFAFAGSYALVVFYNNAQNELSGPDGHVINSKVKVNPQASASSNLLSGIVPNFFNSHAQVAQQQAIARPSDDLQYLVVEYDVQTAVAMGILILAGGWFAMAGATTAILLECSKDGPTTYAEIKRNWKQSDFDKIKY